MKRFNALTIAGTDPSGGAGIQADLKTFSALGVYGASVITALVAQNTMGVQSVCHLDPDFVGAQLHAVFSDLRFDSIKIGMLDSADIVDVVADWLAKTAVPWIVLDTVMLAKSGDRLLSPQAIRAVYMRLLPVASIITPNLPEAAELLNVPVAKNEQEMCQQGRMLLDRGCQAVLLKGGHLGGMQSPDWLVTHSLVQRFTQPRINTRNTHGTGCSLSSALAALRPQYNDWGETVRAAKNWLQGALEQADSLEVGKGHGPIHHFYRWW